MEWNTYEELVETIEEDNEVVAPDALYNLIKGKLNYTIEYAEDRVEQLHNTLDEKLYANCLSSEKFKSQQVKSTSAQLSEELGYTHHLDKLADYILYASFDNLEDRAYSDSLREEKKEISKLKKSEVKQKALIINRDKQTTRSGRLVNKRHTRSYREDEAFSLDLGSTNEEFYHTNNIEPIHYTHVDKELNQKKVFKNSFRYWAHFGQHNQTGFPSIFSRVDYSEPYFMVAFKSLSSINEAITELMSDIDSAEGVTKRKQLEKLKRELTEDYNIASELLRKRVEPSASMGGKSTDILTLNEDKVDYTNKDIVKAIIYGFAEFKQMYSTKTSTLHWCIIQDFEEAFRNIKLTKLQEIIFEEVTSNSNWSYNDLIDRVNKELKKDYSPSGIGYHLDGFINKVLQYFIEKELKDEQNL